MPQPVYVLRDSETEERRAILHGVLEAPESRARYVDAREANVRRKAVEAASREQVDARGVVDAAAALEMAELCARDLAKTLRAWRKRPTRDTKAAAKIAAYAAIGQYHLAVRASEGR